MGWDRIGKGREGKERLGYCGDRYLPDTLSLLLSLSLGYPPVPTYLTRLCKVCMYIFHLSHLQVLIFIDNFQISSYLSLTLLR